jgi:hypothetical protein
MLCPNYPKLLCLNGRHSRIIKTVRNVQQLILFERKELGQTTVIN